MIPILLNHDVREVVGSCDVHGNMSFNTDIDFNLYDIVPNVCCTSKDGITRILKIMIQIEKG